MTSKQTKTAKKPAAAKSSSKPKQTPAKAPAKKAAQRSSKPAEKPTKEPKQTKVARDFAGNRAGSSAAAINALLSPQIPMSTKELAEKSGAPLSRVSAHLQFLRQKELAYRAEAGWVLCGDGCVEDTPKSSSSKSKRTSRKPKAAAET